MHPYTPCNVTATKMMPPSGRAYLQVYCVKFWSILDWQFPRYSNFCITPLLRFLQSDPLSATASPSTWDMASDLMPMPQQLISQSAQATADTIASALTARTASISLPVYHWDSQDAYHSFSIFCHTLGELAPPQLHSARQRGPPQVWFCSPRHQIPRNACTMDANQQQRGTESDQGESFYLPWMYPTGNGHMTSTPMCILENSKILWPGQEGGPPRSHHTHQDTEGPMRDDQWWALRARTTLPYCPCILPWGKAPRKTYGQAIQDTLQWAG